MSLPTVSDAERDARAPSPRALHKGQQTRATILDAALGLASHVGLEGLSIGALAEVTQMSKSGVFAHFGSREELQISVIREYHARFDEEVFRPAIREARGLPRLIALFDRWVRRVSLELDSGCIYISGAVEFDDRPGPVRDRVREALGLWLRVLAADARRAGFADPEQIAFELNAIAMGTNHAVRLQGDPDASDRCRAAMERVLTR